MEVSDQIIKVIDALSEKMGIAIDWTTDSILPMLQQLCTKCVNYKISISIIWLIVGVIMGLISIGLICVIHKHPKLGVETYFNCTTDKTSRILIYICIYSLLIIGLSIILNQTLNIVACVAFPEKIVLEELMNIRNSL